MSISTDEGNNLIRTRMMDGYDDDDEQLLLGTEKKRRLSVDQVKALEKNFEVENKLEPERKLNLAQELGLQPRQVAVWFQNRRARWKTKQLERDYGVLKASYDALNLDFEKLHRHNQALLKEIRELKSNNKELTSDDDADFVQPAKGEKEEEEEATVMKIKDPSSSDSCDSSAILNEDVGGININNVSNNDFQFQDSKVGSVDCHHQQQPLKIEEHNFFGEESCSTLFSDDQAPTLHWYEWS